MARPKGSTNKPKTSGNLYITNFEKQICGASVNKDSMQGWVKWGAKNDFPLLLLNLYNESPTHRASINFGVQSIVGNGIDYEAMRVDGTQVFPNTSYSWDELIRNIALDYMLYGSYAIQIIINKDGKTYSFYHLPLEKVRWSPYDEEGNVTSYWVSNDWTSVSLNPPVEIEAFDMRDNFKIEKGKPYLYVYRQYSPTQNYYTSPHYTAGIKAIQAELEFLNFDLKHVVNGFSAAGVLTLPQVETDEERRTIINNIQNMFQGGDNANLMAITFRNNIEDKPVEYTSFNNGQSNVNQYADSNQRAINRILSSHQIPSPMLIGMPDANNSGFSSDADKIETAYQLYNKLTGNYNRMCVIKTINQMFKMNGVDVEIIMKPLSFSDFGNDANVAERTTVEDNNNDNEIPEEND